MMIDVSLKPGLQSYSTEPGTLLPGLAEARVELPRHCRRVSTLRCERKLDPCTHEFFVVRLSRNLSSWCTECNVSWKR